MHHAFVISQTKMWTLVPDTEPVDPCTPPSSKRKEGKLSLPYITATIPISAFYWTVRLRSPPAFESLRWQ